VTNIRVLTDEALTFRSQGWSLRRIGRHFGVSAPAVWYYLKQREGFTESQLGVGRCDICGREALLDSDHDHHTGQPRGLLCRGCNVALGLLKDSETSLTAALAYLRRYRQ
jgi:Recombination endonuclease VII